MFARALQLSFAFAVPFKAVFHLTKRSVSHCFKVISRETKKCIALHYATPTVEVENISYTKTKGQNAIPDYTSLVNLNLFKVSTLDRI